MLAKEKSRLNSPMVCTALCMLSLFFPLSIRMIFDKTAYIPIKDEVIVVTGDTVAILGSLFLAFGLSGFLMLCLNVYRERVRFEWTLVASIFCYLVFFADVISGYRIKLSYLTGLLFVVFGVITMRKHFYGSKLA